MRIKLCFLKRTWYVRPNINTGMAIILAWNASGYALVISRGPMHVLDTLYPVNAYVL